MTGMFITCLLRNVAFLAMGKKIVAGPLKKIFFAASFIHVKPLPKCYSIYSMCLYSIKFDPDTPSNTTKANILSKIQKKI